MLRLLNLNIAYNYFAWSLFCETLRILCLSFAESIIWLHFVFSELISPDDLLQACSLWEKFDVCALCNFEFTILLLEQGKEN